METNRQINEDKIIKQKEREELRMKIIEQRRKEVKT